MWYTWNDSADFSPLPVCARKTSKVFLVINFRIFRRVKKGVKIRVPWFEIIEILQLQSRYILWLNRHINIFKYVHKIETVNLVLSPVTSKKFLQSTKWSTYNIDEKLTHVKALSTSCFLPLKKAAKKRSSVLAFRFSSSEKK